MSGQENYNIVMDAKHKVTLILFVVAALGVAASRSLALAQQAAPAPSPAVSQMLDEVAATVASTKAAGMTANIAAVSGSVKVRRVKTLFWENAKAGQEVAEGDYIKTGKDGQAKIAFEDGNFLYIKKNSVVVIEALSRDETTKKYDAVFKTTKAHLKAQIDNKESLNNFEIRTPIVVCGVRGTILYLNVGPGFADVFVERGSAFLRSPVSGQERELMPGMATTADRTGQIAEPTPPPPEKLTEMQAGWEPLPPPPPEGSTAGSKEGSTEGSAEGSTEKAPPPPPPIVLADTLPPPPAPDTTMERQETQETTKTDYINNPPPVDGDFDNDGISDNNDPDDDNDYLSDVDELAFGTGVQNMDTDGDGLTDWEEVRLQGTNPLLVNTDGTHQNDLNDLAPTDPTFCLLEDRTTIRDARYAKIDPYYVGVVAGLRADIKTMLADSLERQKDYIMDCMSDAQRHKVLFDSSGMRVRLEQYIFRPAPNKITISALTYRTSAQLTLMHVEATFNTSLDGMSSQQIKNLHWEAFLQTVPDYGVATLPPSVYPKEMLVGFEWNGSPYKLEARRIFGNPMYSTSWTQSVSDSASFNGGAFLDGTYSLITAGNSGTSTPATFQWDESVGPATFSVDVRIITDTGTQTGGTFSFYNPFDVLGVNLFGFVAIDGNTIEMKVHFGANHWEYLFLPVENLVWRGTPQWEEELTW